ncbi:HAD family hydrolase [Methyloligella sp. 2.7D]|uniref:HAD family hydrolase n=1 Tax=unclassified Methyloligella TaxID=2625955 RepID=UPI00157C1A05|nr:HAD family hydrolase [Methyloligella sp. GL2]QKP77186.1 phosphoglycolate phosphatase [Methyloligella sp. GL2]
MTEHPFHRATIVFDLDGTLVDTAPDLTNALNAVLTAEGFGPVPRETIRDTVAFGARAMIAEGLRQRGAEAAAADEARLDAMLARFIAHYEANIADDSIPFAGAGAVLDALEDQGAILAVCTNKREALARKLLQSLGLDHRFAAILGRDTLPVSKPDPRHLTETIGRAGGEAAKSLMIGDSAVDIRTAKAAEIPVIAVSFGYGPTEELTALSPEALIDHFDRLIPEAHTLLQRRGAKAAAQS